MKDKLNEVKAALWIIKEVLQKAIKEGPTLNYGKMNARANTMVSPEAKTTADTNAKLSEKNAPTLVYGKNSITSSVPEKPAPKVADVAGAATGKPLMREKTAQEVFAERKQMKNVQKSDEEMAKDELDEKIKSKMKMEMDKRGFGEADAIKHVIDRDKGANTPKAPKPPKMLN